MISDSFSHSALDTELLSFDEYTSTRDVDMNSKLGKSYSALEDMFIDRSNSDEMLVCEILPNLETSPKQLLGPGTSLWAASPLMYLKYLYLFVDSMVQDEFDVFILN
ncbi:hypothetical protein HDV02_000947 [Globomyces sp. JEL0801]|nr:hypothetical protein HDV02_000947 [Globomyces sp. JEL0801]